jgi:cell fate regulator YaaT (PSP1 superfamily)
MNMPEVVGIQFLKGGKAFFFLSPGKRLPLDTLCVVETEHGPQMARVVRPTQTIPDNRAQGPLRKVLRVATPHDSEQYAANERREQEAYRLCRRLEVEKKLSMKLVNVTYTLDGRKAVFYFTAENRVDFRELVKDLAQALKVKIEMRQIGVRDEARRLGGVGCCGRTLCCCSFLKDFVSVSIRMAKEQNLSLNPTKVSGLCGRLMCCLSYEYGCYTEERRKQIEESQRESPAEAGSGCAGCEQAKAQTETIKPGREKSPVFYRRNSRLDQKVKPGVGLSSAPTPAPQKPQSKFEKRRPPHHRFHEGPKNQSQPK